MLHELYITKTRREREREIEKEEREEEKGGRKGGMKKETREGEIHLEQRHSLLEDSGGRTCP